MENLYIEINNELNKKERLENNYIDKLKKQQENNANY